MEACEEKPDKYQETIKDITPQSLVYIDQSGIEMTICKDRGGFKRSEKLLGKKSGKIAGYVNNKTIAPVNLQSYIRP